MKYTLKLHQEYDDYDDVIRQVVMDEYNNILLDVYNCSDCPEDAIIGRAMNQLDVLEDGINFGIILAQKGYDDIDWVDA